MLYKFTPDINIAQQISTGIFRFYELTKYINIEDEFGRSDPDECSVTFTDEECDAFPSKIPIASLGGVEFSCKSIKPSNDYIRSYFVFCLSTEMSSQAIGDSKYAVELHKDIFDVFKMLLSSLVESHEDKEKFFTHGEVEYFDIHNHPTPLNGNRWREVYLKHSRFSYQSEYRAALFCSDYFFNEIGAEVLPIECKICDKEGNPLDFNLKILLKSSTDCEGWRYIEFDISEFSANISGEPSKIIELDYVFV